MEKLEIIADSQKEALYEAQKLDTGFSFMYSFKQKNPHSRVFVFAK